MIIKKFETFDYSKDDFDFGKKSVLLAIDTLIQEYEDFSRNISPKNWRSSGTHFTELRQMKENINRFEPVTAEEKEIDWVKQARANESASVSSISDLKIGDVITYQGSRYEVTKEGDVTITIKSKQTERTININQGQLEQFGVKKI